jgi:hypothetical protein
MLGTSLVGQLLSDKGYVGKMVVGKLSVIGNDWHIVAPKINDPL